MRAQIVSAALILPHNHPTRVRQAGEDNLWSIAPFPRKSADPAGSVNIGYDFSSISLCFAMPFSGPGRTTSENAIVETNSYGYVIGGTPLRGAPARKLLWHG
jgi:hypothetical protein